MNSKKIILGILIGIFFIIVLSTNVFAIVRPTREFYVNDYANLLSSDTENYIINVNKNLVSQTKAQVVVVTINSLEGKSLEDYSTELYRSFGIGDSKLNNGVLILIAWEERECRIEVGYGLEGVLNDAKAGRIQDNYMIPYLKQDDWDNGIRNGFNAIIEELENEYGVDIESESAVTVEEEKYDDFLFFMEFSILISIIVSNIRSAFIGKKIILSNGIYMLFVVFCAWYAFRDWFRVLFATVINALILFSRSTFVFIGGRGNSSRGGGFGRRRFFRRPEAVHGGGGSSRSF